MKIFTTRKVLALAAGMLLTFAQDAQAGSVKPSGGSVNANVLISKVFYAGAVRLNDASPKNYMYHQYVELYNNSADTIDIAGLYVAFPNSDNAAAAWTAADMAEQHKDSIVVKQVFRIPAGEPRLLTPGQSVVITNSAIDHSQIAEGNVDLSTADYEIKSTNKSYADIHNEAVPALEQVYTSSAALDFMNILNPGPAAVILLAADTKIDTCPKTFAKGKTSGNEYLIVPGYKTIDCVDIVKQKTPSADDKRIPETYDAGFCVTDSTGSFNGQAVMRKTAFVCKDGRAVLFDTNNSSNDFMAVDDLSLRTYSSQMSGLSDTTLVVPESGFVATLMPKPFFSTEAIQFAYVNASAKSVNFTYNEFAGDSLLLMKGDWIAIAQPGTYTLKMSEAQSMLRSRSTAQQWSTEDHKELTGGQKTRSIYKFTNAVGKVGFQRVPQTSEGGYNVADFTDGDRLYVSLTPAIVTNFSATFGMSDLDFIPWMGSTPTTVTEGIETVGVKPATENVIFDLQGRRVNGTPRHGLYIVNGKKVLF